MNKPKLSSYKGNPTITLNPDDKWPFSFGVTKAKLILQHLDDIKAFVDSHKDPTPMPSADPDPIDQP